MLKITRQIVIDRNADRERNLRGSLRGDLLTSMRFLRFIMHQLAVVITRGCQNPRAGIGIKCHAYCPVAVSSSALPRTWQRPTAAVTATGVRSAGYRV